MSNVLACCNFFQQGKPRNPSDGWPLHWPCHGWCRRHPTDPRLRDTSDLVRDSRIISGVVIVSLSVCLSCLTKHSETSITCNTWHTRSVVVNYNVNVFSTSCVFSAKSINDKLLFAMEFWTKNVMFHRYVNIIQEWIAQYLALNLLLFATYHTSTCAP